MDNVYDSSPIVNDCTFSGNSALGGGGMFNWESCLTVTNCTFNDNKGGGIHNSDSNMTLSNCTFSGNSAGLSGGISNIIYNNVRNVLISNSTFSGNSIGMYNSGIGPITVSNCTFNDNYACEGGGVYNELYEGSLTFINCTFNNNVTMCSFYCDGRGGGMFNIESNPNVIGCTFSGNTADSGGGMCNFLNSNPAVSNCTFNNNSAISNEYQHSKGGGMYNEDNSSPVVSDCTFSDNSAYYDGGGMANEDNSNPVVSNCTFSNNIVTLGSYDNKGGGGGMNNNNSSSPIVDNCVFINNTALSGDFHSGRGGGISNYDGSTVAVGNCTFSGNTATNSGGGINNYDTSSATVTNSILWGNSDSGGTDESAQINGDTIITYSCVQGWTGSLGGVGNIGADPFFVSGPGGDYYLSQINAGQGVDSPCVDAGSDTAANLGMDILSTRTDEVSDVSVVDMGYHYSAVIFVKFADIDENLHIDFLDFARLAADWLECSDPCDANCTPGILAGDIIPDNYVNIYDLAFFAECWLYCLVEPAKGSHPANGSTVVDPNRILSWAAGNGALEHDVYLGTDANAVADANYSAEEYMGTVPDANFDPCTLDVNTVYYWRVDEVGPRCTAKGNVWSFKTWGTFIDLNLVSWWKFDEGSGTIAYDSAGSNNGTIAGNPAWVTGHTGAYALDFDGTGDYVNVGNDSSLGVDAFTISAWVYREQSGKDWQTIVDKSGGSSSHGGYALYTNADDKVQVALLDGAAPSPSFRTDYSFPANTWVHVAATFNGGTVSSGDIKVYFNAVEQTGTESNYGTSLKSNTRDVYIGTYQASTTTTGKWNGKIDDVRIYNRVLSLEEIYAVASGE
jgi:parallel beta-helix repeat protein